MASMLHDNIGDRAGGGGGLVRAYLGKAKFSEGKILLPSASPPRRASTPSNTHPK